MKQAPFHRDDKRVKMIFDCSAYEAQRIPEKFACKISRGGHGQICVSLS